MEVLVALVIMLPLILLVVVIWLFARRLSARAKFMRAERERLEAVVAGHREMAAAHDSSVEELAPKVQAHREAAADHAQRAEQLEERIERERRQAEFHEQRADETDDERGRI